jgi:monoamine oxidase
VSSPLDRLSLLQILWWVRKSGGILRALHSGIQFRIAEGAQAVSQTLARGLEAPLLLSAPVRRIADRGSGVTADLEDGTQLAAQVVVVAVPLIEVRAIEFEPPLRPALRALHDELGFGRITKVAVSGRIPARVKHRLVIGGRAVTLMWRRGSAVEGLVYDEAADAPEDVLLGDMADAFGVDSWRSSVVTRWNREPYVGGSYLVARPGELARHGAALLEDQGNVCFAGNERSSAPCTMEGAVESGERAGARALCRLRSTRRSLATAT